ncbi:hypothetical protein [Gemmatimonas sp.]|uniref:hypothetical protein n=1 Tax=Gemmatimonas sp. TaxID=1962908 RepID=UPI0035662D36
MLHAGDIGCVTKLRSAHPNDTLSTPAHPICLAPIEFPEPVVQFAVRAFVRGDEDTLQLGLHGLHDEAPTFSVHYNQETHETIVGGMGARHLEVPMTVLRRKLSVQAELAKPRIAFRETRTAKAEGKVAIKADC